MKRAAVLYLLLGLTVAIPALGNAHVKTSDTLRFEVMLDDKPIGIHNFHMETRPDEVRIRTTAAFDVKLLFLTAYRYRHQSRGLWQEGCYTLRYHSIDAQAGDET